MDGAQRFGKSILKCISLLYQNCIKYN
jgi:hypothetical protein